jgi:methionyl-tRNA formyltransferase
MSTTAIEPNVVFMGTPDFAVPSLKALAAGPYMITVVTQPDRPAGRGGKLTPPPVKVAAQELGLPVIQPETLRDPDFRARLAALNPAVTVLVAYGEYLAPSLLDLPARGSVNLHPSLLPRWRGSTPIQSAILAGDEQTGVSIIKMDRGLDTGPIIAQRPTSIGHEETHPELSAHLAQLGADLLAEVLPLWLRGEIEAVPQHEQGVTLTRTLAKEDGEIDWTQPAEEIARRVRALQPWPGTYTHWGDRLLKILRARPSPISATLPPGTVSITPGPEKKLLVQTGDGSLELLDLQLAGKAPLPTQSFLAGYSQIAGSLLTLPQTPS